MSLNLNLSKMSVSILIIEFMSMLKYWECEFSYFFVCLLLSFSSRFFTEEREEREEILVLDLLREYTLSLRLYLVVDVEPKPWRLAMDYFIFWLILDWLDFSNPSKLVLS